MSIQRRDPAEERSYLRFFYRDWRPTRLGKLVVGFWTWLAGLGLAPRLLVSLHVRDRNSQRMHAAILVAATYHGQRYLVSMLGNDSEWVRNARAAGGAAFIKRWGSHPVTLTEIPVAQRAPILKAWAQVATSGRQHLPVAHDAPPSAFDAIAADYPVFRIDSAA